jgi:hypothetical protein
VLATLGAVQTTGASSPYAIRDVAGTLVCHAMVAENGVRETVCTSWISGGGPVGALGTVVVAVVSLGGLLAGGVVTTPGRARNLRSLAYGELKVASTALPVPGCEPYVVTACPVVPESRRRPGPDGPPVFRPTGVTGRPLGGAKPSEDCAAYGVADAARTGAEPEPGRATFKPIVVPATTASRSQQMVRSRTF